MKENAPYPIYDEAKQAWPFSEKTPDQFMWSFSALQ